VVSAAGALGASREPAWKRLIAAWEFISREQTHHMQEQEELVLDRVQFLFARGRLVHGAVKERLSFDALMTEHDKLSVLRKRVEDELANTVALHVDSDEAARLRNAIKAWLAAFAEHTAFERHALVPTLAPFLD
jgi:hypothetical protein